MKQSWQGVKRLSDDPDASQAVFSVKLRVAIVPPSTDVPDVSSEIAYARAEATADKGLSGARLYAEQFAAVAGAKDDGMRAKARSAALKRVVAAIADRLAQRATVS